MPRFSIYWITHPLWRLKEAGSPTDLQKGRRIWNMPTTDLQKKNELRQELRLLQKVMTEFSDHLEPNVFSKSMVVKDVRDRIEDIQKALED